MAKEYFPKTSMAADVISVCAHWGDFVKAGEYLAEYCNAVRREVKDYQCLGFPERTHAAEKLEEISNRVIEVFSGSIKTKSVEAFIVGDDI